MSHDSKAFRQYMQDSGRTVYDAELAEAFEAGRNEAALAERHRIYAAIDADYGAFLRDQGFQEWRTKKQQEKTK